MEPRQRAIIVNNMDTLISTTICKVSLLARLQAAGVLSEEDVEEIDQLGSSKTRTAQSHKFYSVMLTKANSFDTLLEGLQDTKQSGALKILIGNKEEHDDFKRVTFDKQAVLGKGSYGTVYRGKLGDRDVAVKRIHTDEFDCTLAIDEIKVLKSCDTHENIVRYFGSKQSYEYFLILLEICEMTLSKWVEEEEKSIDANPLDVLKQTTVGLGWLHEHNIVHRDLKPDNILFTRNPVKVKISDFGLSKKIVAGKSFVSASSIGGTQGWVAPEILSQALNKNFGNCKFTYASDVFALGCVYYFVMTNGKHPFGDPFRSQGNILDGKSVVDENQIVHGCRKNMLFVRLMISPNPKWRPSCFSLLACPVFWTLDRHTSFILDVNAINKEILINSIPAEGCSTCQLYQSTVNELKRTIGYPGNNISLCNNSVTYIQQTQLQIVLPKYYIYGAEFHIEGQQEYLGLLAVSTRAAIPPKNSNIPVGPTIPAKYRQVEDHKGKQDDPPNLGHASSDSEASDSEEESDEDRPLQLLRIESEDEDSLKLHLNQKNLDSVIKSTEGRPITVISVVGPPRLGKSLLLNHIKQSLEEKESGSNVTCSDKQNRKPVKGFKLNTRPSKSKYCMKGIWIWSKAFLLEIDDSEIAVILLDTQGLDFNSNYSNAVLGVAFLSSSVLICNVDQSDKCFHLLETYFKYGLTSIENEPDLLDERQPFQRICFLFRDWVLSDHFEYGGTAGTAFLRAKVESLRGRLKKETKAGLRKCFEQVDGFLMPSVLSGAQASSPLSQSFQGCVDEFNEEFATQLEDFLGVLIKNENLLTKKILGAEVTANDFSNILQEYVKMFNTAFEEDGSIDDETIWESTCKIFHENIVRSCTAKYEEVFMRKCIGIRLQDQEQIQSAHSAALKQANIRFKKARKIQDLQIEYENKMLKEVNVLFEKRLQQYESFHYAFLSYQEQMWVPLESSKSPKEFMKTHKQIKESIIANFNKKLGNSNISLRRQYEKDLDRKIEDMYSELKDDYQILRVEAVEVAGVKQEARKYYHEIMRKNIKHGKSISPLDLLKEHTQTSNAVIKQCQSTRNLNKNLQNMVKNWLEQSYQKYKDENDMALNNQDAAETAIGIDLGTTHCCVAVYRNGRVHIIRNTQGNNTTPSYVTINKDGLNFVVGPASKSNAHRNFENTIFDAKRMIGRHFSDPILQRDMEFWPFTVIEGYKGPVVEVFGKHYSPEQISSLVLKQLVTDAAKFLGITKVKKAVITVPVYFTDGQRAATIEAGKLAGLEVITLLNEPTAAAYAYMFELFQEETRNVLIFDLGGGTFDVAVLRTDVNNIKILTVDGDSHLGGEDVDKRMMEYCARQFLSEHYPFSGKDSTLKTESDAAKRRLRRLQSYCENGKMELSYAMSTTIDVDAFQDEIDLKVLITRDKFEELNKPHFDKAIKIVERALTSAKLSKDAIDDIFLVGGSTRIPMVQDLLTNFFKKALNHSINPDEAVAYGAAVKAALLNGDKSKKMQSFTSIQDITPMSLGIKAYVGDAH